MLNIKEAVFRRACGIHYIRTRICNGMGRENVVEITRQLIGKTNPKDALPGTIRGDYGMFVGKNIIHGSDSLESAEREIDIFFKQEELVPYQKLMADWVY